MAVQLRERSEIVMHSQMVERVRGSLFRACGTPPLELQKARGINSPRGRQDRWRHGAEISSLAVKLLEVQRCVVGEILEPRVEGTYPRLPVRLLSPRAGEDEFVEAIVFLECKVHRPFTHRHLFVSVHEFACDAPPGAASRTGDFRCKRGHPVVVEAIPCLVYRAPHSDTRHVQDFAQHARCRLSLS